MAIYRRIWSITITLSSYVWISVMYIIFSVVDFQVSLAYVMYSVAVSIPPFVDPVSHMLLLYDPCCALTGRLLPTPEGQKEHSCPVTTLPPTVKDLHLQLGKGRVRCSAHVVGKVLAGSFHYKFSIMCLWYEGKKWPTKRKMEWQASGSIIVATAWQYCFTHNPEFYMIVTSSVL